MKRITRILVANRGEIAVRVIRACQDLGIETVIAISDSLLAKVITEGSNRVETIERMKYALAHFVISGVDTTVSFHRRILDHPDFVNNQINACWKQRVLLTS